MINLLNGFFYLNFFRLYFLALFPFFKAWKLITNEIQKVNLIQDIFTSSFFEIKILSRILGHGGGMKMSVWPVQVNAETQIDSEIVSHGMNHAEGGWPKTMDASDIESTGRYRKKVQKDVCYQHTVMEIATVSTNTITTITI